MTGADIGVMAGLRASGPSLRGVAELGLRVCQLVSWEPGIWTRELAVRVRQEAADSGVRISGFWAGWPGPAVWDFLQGPATLGIVPPAHRAERVVTLKKAGLFARDLGVQAVITHLGFIPENPGEGPFEEVVAVVKDIAVHLDGLGIQFWFETGQETPITMLRLIDAVGTGNLGINLDPANLVLYGKGNPVDALDVFGRHVRNVHAKDGLYPTDGARLGQEVKVGEGAVRWPDLARKLESVGYRGPYIIEREIEGDQQKKDISETVGYLGSLLSKGGPA
jgi:L-ribulose-5-phosphate 3-epimerase